MSNAPRFVIAGLLLACLPSCATKNTADGPRPSENLTPVSSNFVKYSGPQLLSYKELSSLAENPNPTGALKVKLDRLLSTPFIDNRAYFKKGLPKANIHPTLGESLRISTWNIEKSVRVPEAANALKSEARFVANMRPEFVDQKNAYDDAVRQRALIAASDVLLLQEMDIGHCRSGYLYSAEHLARKLGMNFAYAPQQLEIDPVHLGLDHIRFANGKVDKKACRALYGQPRTYRGVFGAAVLSRYPIKSAQLFQLKTQPYDWYANEIKKTDFLEEGRQLGSSLLFKFQPIREVKVGGRSFTRVDLHVPGLPLDTLTVINIHLEIKTTPKQREEQIKEILSYMGDIKNPVVMAGDFNSSSTDVSATSVFRFTSRTTTDPTNLLSAGLYAADITGAGQARRLINTYKNYRNPLAWDVPVILPNKVKGLFSTIENYRFADGGAFDFRGSDERSTLGVGGKLSNANQRAGINGFTFTFALPRTIGVIGKQRLDWIFVKSFLNHPVDKSGPYKLAPHFGETLHLMNLSQKQPISDHHPITTVLPLNEPSAE